MAHRAQVHRFLDRVAIHLGDGATVYLTGSEAHAIAIQMLNCNQDITKRQFRESTFKTFEINIEGSK